MEGGRDGLLHHDSDLGNLSLCFYVQEPWAWAGTLVPRLVLGTKVVIRTGRREDAFAQRAVNSM